MASRFIRRLAATLWLIGLATLPASAAEVILYDFENFGGASIRLTQSAPDLDAFNFDNDVESIRVISGIWSFHRDDYFQNNNGPPITLGPGDYADIEQLGFPDDKMSSVQLLQDDQPPPPPDCPAPYQALGSNGQCVYTCAANTVPDPSTGECACAQGLVEVDQDAQGRRICGPAQLPDPPTATIACLPNSVPTDTGCACIPGTVEVSRDSMGRPNCLFQRGGGTSVTPIQPLPADPPRIVVTPTTPMQPDERYTVSAQMMTQFARQFGIVTAIVVPPGVSNSACQYVTDFIVTTRQSVFPAPATSPSTCLVRPLSGRQLNQGWRLVDATWRTEGPQGTMPTVAQLQGGPPLQIVFGPNSIPFNPQTLIIETLTLQGPGGRDWRDAFR